jgi:hypothetical protein
MVISNLFVTVGIHRLAILVVTVWVRKSMVKPLAKYSFQKK